MKNCLFKCQCQGYHYLEIISDDDGDYWFIFIEEPQNIVEWLKRLFKKRSFINEIVLNKKQINKLKKALKKNNR